jgi:hypothetical protein
MELEEFGALKLLGAKFVITIFSLLYLPLQSIFELGELDSAQKCVRHLVEEKNYMMFWYAGLLSLVVNKILGRTREKLLGAADAGFWARYNRYKEFRKKGD